MLKGRRPLAYNTNTNTNTIPIPSLTATLKGSSCFGLGLQRFKVALYNDDDCEFIAGINSGALKHVKVYVNLMEGLHRHRKISISHKNVSLTDTE